MDWSHMDYLWIIVVFLLSAVWTLIMTAPIHCRGSIGDHVTEVWWRSKLIYILDGLRVSTFLGELLLKRSSHNGSQINTIRSLENNKG